MVVVQANDTSIHKCNITNYWIIRTKIKVLMKNILTYDDDIWMSNKYESVIIISQKKNFMYLNIPQNLEQRICPQKNPYHSKNLQRRQLC